MGEVRAGKDELRKYNSLVREQAQVAKSKDEGPGVNELCYEEQEACEGSPKFVITVMNSTDSKYKLGNVDYMKVMYASF